MSQTASRPSASIVAAAVALLVASSGIVLWSVWYLRAIYHLGFRQALVYAQAPSIATFDLLTIPQIAFGLLSIVTSIGLLRLREKARSAAIFLSIFSVVGVVCAILLFISESHANGRESLNAGFGVLLYAGLLIILLPLSIWWLVLLTRNKVRRQFQ